MSSNDGHLLASRLVGGLGVLLLGLAAVGCGDSAGPSTHTTLDLQGVVTDASSGDPIFGASVEIVHCTELFPLENCTLKRLAGATTARDGRYHIIYPYTFLCDAPSYQAPFWARASASGYQMQSTGAFTDTPLLCTAAEQSLDFALPPQPAASGFVQ